MTMIETNENINVPGLGLRRFLIRIHIDENKLLKDELKMIKHAIKEFIENGEQIGDVDFSNYVLEFMYVKEIDLGEAYEAHFIGVLREIEEPGYTCKAVYKIVINYQNYTVDVYDISFIADLENRTPINQLIKK